MNVRRCIAAQFGCLVCVVLFGLASCDNPATKAQVNRTDGGLDGSSNFVPPDGASTIESDDGGLDADSGVDSGELAVAPSRKIYIADSDNHVIRVVYENGTTEIVAGSGTVGFGGDDAGATEALLNAPAGVAVDGAGNIYIADRGNHVIRRVSSQGIISTIAGTPQTAGYNDAGVATAAQLNGPKAVAVDKVGNVYIADSHNQIVRRVDVANGTISTIAGVPEVAGYNAETLATKAQLNEPTGVAVGVNGNIYIADGYNFIVRRVDNTGTISTVAGQAMKSSWNGDNVPATDAGLCEPYGIVLDPDLTMYISDWGANVVRRVSNTGIISTIAGIAGGEGYTGDAGATTTPLRSPAGIALDQAGNVYIAETGNHIVRMVNDAGIITTIAGTPEASGKNPPSDGGMPEKATTTLLSSPRGVAIDMR